MPKVYRGMRKAEDGRPEVGSGGLMLGIRFSASTGAADIEPDSAGNVHPGTGGMSVSPNIESLPPHAIPRKLHQRYPKAAGSNKISLWHFGEGLFKDGPLSQNLQLRVDPDDSNHGFVEPSREMASDEFVSAINATREQWSEVEDQ